MLSNYAKFEKSEVGNSSANKDELRVFYRKELFIWNPAQFRQSLRRQDCLPVGKIANWD